MAQFKTRGSIGEMSGSWYWKFYSNVEFKTGTACERKQQRLMLARKDETHPDLASVTDLYRDALTRLEEFETKIAAGVTVEIPEADMTVSQFYNTKFLPWLKSHVATGQKSHATLVTYERLWNTYLKDHFNGTKKFKNYQPYVGQQFLDELRKDDGTPLGYNTVRHIHSAASGIFARYIRSMKQVGEDADVAIFNPWHSIKVSDVPTISAEQGPAATEREVEIIMNNLESARGGRDDWSIQMAQVALAVGIYAGLRPSEIAGLKWEAINLDAAEMKICRAHVYGKTKEKTKTEKDRIVLYDDKLTGILRAWWGVNECPATGWVFPNRDGNPVNMSSMIDRHILPNLGGAEWHDFYALRRGAITSRVNGTDGHDKWSYARVAEFAGNTEAVIEKHYHVKDYSLSRDARERDRDKTLALREAGEVMTLPGLTKMLTGGTDE